MELETIATAIKGPSKQQNKAKKAPPCFFIRVDGRLLMQNDLRGMVAAACEAIGNPGALVGGSLDHEPRFELFHASNSICSQKVRVILAHHGIGYRSHLLNIFKGQTYLPHHVRLRMLGCQRLGVPLVATHTGSTSVSKGGCDPAVVPTLVDWQTEEVFIDSKLICLHVDRQAPAEARLRPKELAEKIDAEIEIVDNLPNYQMLAGKPPGEDLRPESRRRSDGTAFALEKVKRCERYLDQFQDDEVLRTAYSAKRAKELRAANALFTADAMGEAYERATRACEGLSSRLSSAQNSWLFGERPTMADLFWIIALARMKNLGAANIWEDRLPPLAGYVEQGERLAAFRFAVLDWPDATY